MWCLVASVACLAGLAAGKSHRRCLKKDPSAAKEWIPFGMEREKPGKKYANVAALPTSVDWRFKDGKLLTGASTNQHMPNYCGACWAFSTTSAISDRIMIAKSDAYYEVNLAPQVLLDCDDKDDGCHGGDPLNALKYISENGITEIGCTQYLAEGHDTGRQCTESSLCMTCSPGQTGCYEQYPYLRFGIAAYGSLSGEQEYLQAIQDGPIVTGMCVTDEVENYIDTFYILNDTSGCTEQDHAVSIVGYGVDSDSTPYWIVRNSWGTWWGQNGYFRVLRGSNNLGIEMDGTWATPITEPSWVNSTDDVKGPAKGKHLPASHKPAARHQTVAERPPFNDWARYGGPVITTPLPSDTIADSDLPDTWIWNDINGTNWLTKSVNQHIPVYCGSCWAQATCSSLSDRLNIQRGKSGRSWFPEIHLSPQVLINNDGGGTCNGGDAIPALQYIHNEGIPDDTCQVYQAINDPHGSNKSLNECYTCEPGTNGQPFTPGTCYEIEPSVYQNYYVSEYASVKGASDMKKEIFERGPIICGIDATSSFEDYTGGVYSEERKFVMLNHDISVVGWGVTDDGTEFWVGRNSWGTWWGEDGFFRIEMYQNNLGIETDCAWGVPTTVKPTVKDQHRWIPGRKHMWTAADSN